MKTNNKQVFTTRYIAVLAFSLVLISNVPISEDELPMENPLFEEFCKKIPIEEGYKTEGGYKLIEKDTIGDKEYRKVYGYSFECFMFPAYLSPIYLYDTTSQMLVGTSVLENGYYEMIIPYSYSGNVTLIIRSWGLDGKFEINNIDLTNVNSIRYDFYFGAYIMY